ncbi:acyltransferase family protein [Undibacterium sp. Tian12W]|uniref:acyltransferase family protein n=1 Tax=Undibacterium sp. Tian12W TaxID=3413054 RepID=UPI003BF37C59
MQNDVTIDADNAGLPAISPAHASTVQTAVTSERLHGLDALRAGALLLGVLLHASISFLPGAKFFWMVSDNQKTVLLGPVFFVIHMFRMPLFFMLAGYFAHLVLQKKGWAGFIKDRFKRITLPLLLGWPVIFAAIVAAIVLAAWVRNGGSLPQKSPPPPAFTADSFPLAHLWFLYMLTLLYVVYLSLWAVCRQLGILPQMRRCADWLMPVISGWFGPILLALPVALALFYTPYWVSWFGVPTPDQSLYPGRAAWLSFGMAFGFGWMLQQSTATLPQWQQRWRWHLSLALLMTAICLYLGGLVPKLVPAVHDESKLIFAWLYAAAAWHFCFGLTGLALSGMGQANTRVRYLADASYWIYLVHLPLVMALQALVSRSEWHWSIKLAAVLLGTLAVALLSYHYLVRFTWIGKLLNGQRPARGRGV